MVRLTGPNVARYFIESIAELALTHTHAHPSDQHKIHTRASWKTFITEFGAGGAASNGVLVVGMHYVYVYEYMSV